MAIVTGVMLIDILGIFAALFAIVYTSYKWRYRYWEKRNVPTFEPSIPFGNLKNPSTATENKGSQIAKLYKQAKSKGWRHFGLYFVMNPSYVAVDLDLVKNIMTKDFDHFQDRGVYTNEKKDPIGCHLFALGGSKWRTLRAKLTPTFTSGKMKVMFQILVDCGLILEKYMEEYVNTKEPIDIKDVLGRFSTDIIGSCAFGLECNSFKDPDSPFRTYGKIMFEPKQKLNSFFRVILMDYPNIARALGIRQIRKEVSDFFTKVVEDTVNYREKNNFVRNDFLQLLINIKESNQEGEEKKDDGTTLTMREIAAQSFVFFIAGFETSSTTMTFALFELATHPDIQEKVREEIKTILGNHNNQITYDSLNQMKYMGQVIDETLRKYPPLSLITRTCDEDYKVPGEEVVIEKDTRVLIPVLGIHYDEEYYKNPEVFDPERFSQRFGIMESKVGLTCLLRNFKVKLNRKTEMPLKMSPRAFVTTSQGGIWLDMEKL
ncbi:hypothetical protein NQ314_009514 [Rhamnusium bicolor]|uniref:Cytochrome P450 n=1 Tax=Rhamnusium bicolor TaxID=1586634 RepID=A0AAV8XYJ6_9CUCU|nr:hypothetical protein NQ314_009514 [Rhamnusium bicolor]